MDIKAHKNMNKNRKYFIYIALAKTLFVYLILQLFFSSCDSDELFYDGDLYSDGALIQVPVSFGDEGQGYTVGDTIMFEIALDSLSFVNELTDEIVDLNNANFSVSFAFANKEGEAIIPSHVLSYGFDPSQEVDSSYIVHFWTLSNKSLVMNDMGLALSSLKLGFVFNTPGDYTLYLINTPNNTIEEGRVDVSYNVSSDNDSEVKQAYAIYLFDVSYKPTVYKGNIPAFYYAGYNEAIVDFKVVKE